MALDRVSKVTPIQSYSQDHGNSFLQIPFHLPCEHLEMDKGEGPEEKSLQVYVNPAISVFPSVPTHLP